MNSHMSNTYISYKIGELLISDQYPTNTMSEIKMLAMATMKAMLIRKLTGLVFISAASASGYASSGRILNDISGMPESQV